MKKRMIFKECRFEGLDFPIETNEDGSVIYYNGKLKKLIRMFPTNSKNPFHIITIKCFNFYVHRIVAKAFVHNPDPENFTVVMHKNGKTLDNYYLNLKWASRKMATAYHWEKFYRPVHEKFSFGLKKIIYEEVKKGRTLKSLADEYGCSDMTICRIKKQFSQ